MNANWYGQFLDTYYVSDSLTANCTSTWTQRHSLNNQVIGQRPVTFAPQNVTVQ